jgi:hypothetical protein
MLWDGESAPPNAHADVGTLDIEHLLLFGHELTERRAASQRTSMSTSVPARERESTVR